MYKIFYFVVFLFLGFTITITIFAGTTGKIAGRVVDIENGQPLPGVNIVIEGTSLGAATNFNGQYVILNLPPGNYSLKFSMMGYADHHVQNVRAVIDQTTTIDAQLRTGIISGEEVVVVAQRPVVQRDISNSQMTIQSEKIEQIPVETVQEVLTLQAGIEASSEGIVVRGGAANQTVFMVDGLSLNDERSNIPYQAVSLSSIQEIQIQTGGFNAEYGNVRSGLVNVVTKQGSPDRYSATISLRYSPAARKNFGPSIYDPYSYFNRPFMDPDVCWTGTDNGAWDAYTQKQYQFFEGWNTVSHKTLQDEDPMNDLTPAGAKRLYEWQHRRKGDIEKPDYIIDAGFGGPVPIVGKALGGLRFFLSYFKEKDMFIFPLSRDNYGENHSQLKLTSDLSSSIKLYFSGLYGEIHSVSPYSWTTTPTGRVLSSQSEIADLVNSTSGNSVLYMPGYYSPSSIYRNLFSLKLTHVLSNNTYYDVFIKNMVNRYDTYKMADRDTSKKYEPIPGYKVDEAPFGYWGYSSTGIDGMSMGGWMNLGRDKSINSTTTFKFDITSQVNFRNQVKAGLEIVYNDFNIKSSTESPSMNTWTRNMIFRINPFRIGAYIQDKLEYEGFIANIGVRLDYSDPNTTIYNLNEYSKFFSAGYGKLIVTEAPKVDSERKWSLNPRLGISHPITEKSKLYFNYGHFRSEPDPSYRFRIQRESNGLVTSLGNPNLELEKTVSYELGFAQSLSELLLLNLAAYYKDVSNQPSWIFYQNVNNSVQYNKATSSNYEDIRGFEVTLTKTSGSWLTGFINYTYDVRTSGYFGLREYYEDPNKQRAYLRLNPYISRPHPRPYARANISFHTPNNFGVKRFGLYPLGNWIMSILAEWRTGSYYTYNPNQIADVVDNVQWRDWYNVDFRLSKTFQIKKYDVQFYLDISNVLNTKYMNFAGFADNYDWLDYLESLNFSWETGEWKGNDKIGDYRPSDVAYDPLEANPNNDPAIKARNDRRKENKSYIDMPNVEAFTFLNPRDFTFGIRINF